ncbi:glycosyltransferase family 4 protein [Flavobacteriaceae bacterium]|nr:glycosyltransferase family 4 protein [Flavobacteriaceae bacterium]
MKSTVILMANYYKPHFGGVENSLNFLSNEYIKLGYNVIILTNDSGLTKKDRLTTYEKVNDSLEIYRFKTYFPKIYIDYLLKLPLELIRIKKTVSFLMNDRSIKKIISRHWITSLGVIISRNKVTYVVPGLAINQDLLSGKDIKSNIINLLAVRPQIFLQKFALKNSKLVVFSRNMKNQILDFLQNEDKLIEIYNPGVDCDKFESKIVPNIREKYNIPEDSFTFLVVGRLIKDKAIQYAIEALSLLENKNTILMIVGDGPERSFLKNLAQKIKY